MEDENRSVSGFLHFDTATKGERPLEFDYIIDITLLKIAG
jgi:hypothetical protein